MPICWSSTSTYLILWFSISHICRGSNGFHANILKCLTSKFETKFSLPRTSIAFADSRNWSVLRSHVLESAVCIDTSTWRSKLRKEAVCWRWWGPCSLCSPNNCCSHFIQLLWAPQGLATSASARVGHFEDFWLCYLDVTLGELRPADWRSFGGNRRFAPTCCELCLSCEKPPRSCATSRCGSLSQEWLIGSWLYSLAYFLLRLGSVEIQSRVKVSTGGTMAQGCHDFWIAWCLQSRLAGWRRSKVTSLRYR